MSNLINHARRELEKSKLFSEGDFYGGMIGNAVMELIEVFSKQKHSGMSASAVIDIFKKLARYSILSPLECFDDEWIEVSDNIFQNNRLSSVFKEGKDGSPYYLDAIIWQEKNGNCFSGTVENIKSRQYINLPFIPKTFYIKIDENRNIIDKDELNKALSYYRQI